MKTNLIKNISKDTYKNIFKLFSSYSNTFNLNEDTLSLYHEFLIKKIQENKTIQMSFNDFESINISYLKKMIKNFLRDKFNEKKRNEISIEIKIENKDETFIPEIYSEINEITNILKKELKEREIKILCYYVNQERYNFLINMSDNAKYKAIERLKKKLNIIWEKYKFSKEAMEIFLKKFIQSEICDKIC